MSKITNVTLRPFCGHMILEVKRNTPGGQVDCYNVSDRLVRAVQMLKMWEEE